MLLVINSLIAANRNQYKECHLFLQEIRKITMPRSQEPLFEILNQAGQPGTDTVGLTNE